MTKYKEQIEDTAKQKFSSNGFPLFVAFLLLVGYGCSDNSTKTVENQDNKVNMEAKLEKNVTTPEPAPKTVAEPTAHSVVESAPEPPVFTARIPTQSLPDSERAAPEIGYGERTEAEILKETPRLAKIGVLGAMSGELRQYGIEASNGAELASDELNAKGGIKGQQFDLLAFDTKGTMSGARQGVELLLKHKAVATVGAATGEVSFSSTKLLNENQLIMISAGSRRRLGDTGPYNFRNTLTDTGAIRALMDYISKNRKWEKFALFSSVLNDYSIKLTAFFKTEILKHKLTVSHDLFLWPAAMSHMQADETSIKGQLAKLTDDKPDAIIFTGDGKEAAELIREMGKMGMRIPLVGGEDLISDEVKKLGEHAAGTLVYSGFDVNTKNPKARRFIDRYTKRFKTPPSRLAALSYDAYYLLAQAVKNAKSMRPSHMRKALLGIRGFHGVTGKMRFDDTGEPIKKPYILEFQKSGAEYNFVSIADPY